MINTKIIYKPRGAHDSESRGGVQGYNTSVSVGADKCNWAQRAGVADVAKVAEKATTSSMADAAHSLTEDAQSVQDARYISKLHADGTPYDLSVGGCLEADGIKTRGSVAGGMDGSGVVATGGTLEVDTLMVRKKAVYNELDIKRTTFSSGDMVYSLAGCTIVEAVDMLDKHRCYFKATDGERTTGNGWRVGDLALCHEADDRGTQRSYYRMVVGAGTDDARGMHYIDIFTGGKTAIVYGVEYAGTRDIFDDMPMAGDVVVQLGNCIDDDRQYAYAIYVSDGRRVDYAGINDFNLDGHIVNSMSPKGWEMDGKSVTWRFESDETGEQVQTMQQFASGIEQLPGKITSEVFSQLHYTGQNLLPMTDFKVADPTQYIQCLTSNNNSYVRIWPLLGETYMGRQVWCARCEGNDTNVLGCLRFRLADTDMSKQYTARCYVQRVADVAGQAWVGFSNTASNAHKGFNYFGSGSGCEAADLPTEGWSVFEAGTAEQSNYPADTACQEFTLVVNSNGFIRFTTPIVDGYEGDVEADPIPLDQSLSVAQSKVVLTYAADEAHNQQHYLRLYGRYNSELPSEYNYTMLRYTTEGVMEQGKRYTFSVWVKRKHTTIDGNHTIYIDCVNEATNTWVTGMEKPCNELPEDEWRRMSICFDGFATRGRLTMCMLYNGDMFFSEPQLEEGEHVSEWSPRPTDADLKLQRTGIDITTGRIDMQADHFTLRNAAGEQTMGVDASGNAVFNGSVNATSGTFSGNIFANSFEIRNGDKPGIRFYTDLTGQPHFVIYNKDGKFMFDLADGGKSVVDNSQQPYYTAEQILGVTLNSIGIKSYDAVHTIVYKYHAFRFNGAMTQPDKVYDGKYFANNTDAASDNNLMQGGNYAVRRVQGGERVVVYSFVNGEMANDRELTSNDYTTIKPGGGIIVTSNGGMVATSLDE